MRGNYCLKITLHTCELSFDNLNDIKSVKLLAPGYGVYKIIVANIYRNMF